jgi:hypothetical protein
LARFGRREICQALALLFGELICQRQLVLFRKKLVERGGDHFCLDTLSLQFHRQALAPHGTIAQPALDELPREVGVVDKALLLAVGDGAVNDRLGETGAPSASRNSFRCGRDGPKADTLWPTRRAMG